MSKRSRKGTSLDGVWVERLETRRLLSRAPLLARPPSAPLRPLGDDMRPATPTVSQSSVPVTPPPPPASLPILNSNPGAPTAIYLDFDGDNLNSSATPYSTDGDSSTFNPSEVADITRAWKDVSTYFAMFDVNVTTAFPSVPFAWDVISNSIAGGYSSVGVFPNSVPQSFNSSDQARNRTSGLAHEIGHNFGLVHQSTYDGRGKKTQEYAFAPDTLHGPLMGIDYDGAVHKWIMGHPNTSVLDFQDDIGIIASKIAAYEPPGGDGFRADDFGNTIASAAPLPAAVNGVQNASGIIERLSDSDFFSFVSGGEISFTASPSGVSGVNLTLSICKPDGTVVASADDPTSKDLKLSASLPAGTYYAIVSSNGNYGDLGQYDLKLSTLPQGWVTQDLGASPAPGTFGSYNISNQTFSISGSGDDIWNSADAFRYTYIPINGNGEIRARVVTQQNTDPWAKAGIMFRQNTAWGASNVFMCITPANGAKLQVRNGDSTSTTQPGGVAANVPTYLRITRSGDLFTAYQSTDGSTWTPVGSATVAMGNVIDVGLAVSSHNNGLTSLVSFDHVSLAGLTGTPQPVYSALPAPSGVVLTQRNANDLRLSWDEVSDVTSYVIESSTDGTHFSTVAVLQPNITTFAIPSLPGGFRYYYRVYAKSGADRSSPSAIVSIINRPSMPTNITTNQVGSSNIVLNWRDTNGEEGYRVERSSDNINFTPIVTLPANTPGYTDSSLSPGTTYYYRIIPTTSTGDGQYATLVTSSLLDTPTNITATEITPSKVTIDWNPVAGATMYRIDRSTDGSFYSTVNSTTQTHFTDNNVIPLGEYYYRIVALSDTADGEWPAPLPIGIPSGNPLASGWTRLDIGLTHRPSVASSNNTGTSFTLITASEHWDLSPDPFSYVFKTFSGDGTISAQIVSQETPSGLERAGLMFRETLSTGSKFVTMDLISSHSQVTSRSDDGGGRALQYGVFVSGPRWLKLERIGNTYNGYESFDGFSWTLVGSASFAMKSQIYVGLFNASGDYNRLTKVSFANVSGSALTQPDTVAPAAPAISNVSPDTGIDSSDGITNAKTLEFSGTAEPGSMVTVSASGVGLIGTVQADEEGGWRLESTTALPDGLQQFTATAKDAYNNLSAVSPAVSITIDTLAPAISNPVFNYLTEQSISLQFSEKIFAPQSPSGMLLHNLTSGQDLLTSMDFDPATLSAVFRSLSGQPLPDGNYQATLPTGSFTDIAGNLPTAPFSFNFYVLGGDANRDRIVDIKDLALLAGNWQGTGKVFNQGDFNYDGIVNAADLGILASHWQSKQPPPLAAALAGLQRSIPQRTASRMISVVG